MAKIFFTKKAEKEFKKIGKTDQDLVNKKIPVLTNSALPLNAKKMVGAVNFYRLRVGKVRIIYEIDEKTKDIWIRKIDYRGNVYENLGNLFR